MLRKAFLLGFLLSAVLLCFAGAVSAAPVSVNVIDDYGATGNGKDNDQDAIASAIRAVDENAEGGTVIFPAGTYYLENGDSAFLYDADNLTLVFEEGAKLAAGRGSAMRIDGNTQNISINGTVELIGDCGNLCMEGGNAQQDGAGVRDITINGNILAHGSVSFGSISHSVANITVTGTVQSGGSVTIAGTNIKMGDIAASGDVIVYNSACGYGRYGYTDNIMMGNISAGGGVAFRVIGLRTDGTGGDLPFDKTNPTKVDHVAAGDIAAGGVFFIEGVTNVKTGNVTITRPGNSVTIRSIGYTDADGTVQFAPIANIEMGDITVAEGSLYVYGADSYTGTIQSCPQLDIHNISIGDVIVNRAAALFTNLRGLTVKSVTSTNSSGQGVFLYNVADSVFEKVTVAEPFSNQTPTGLSNALQIDRNWNTVILEYQFTYSGISPYVKSMSIGGGDMAFSGGNILVKHATADFTGESGDGDGLNLQTGPYMPKNVRYHYQYKRLGSSEYTVLGTALSDSFVPNGITKQDNGYTAVLWNRNDTAAAVKAVWAAYDTDGNLLEVCMAEDYIRPFFDGGQVQFVSPPDFAVQGQEERVRFYLWESGNVLKPVCEPFCYKPSMPSVPVLPSTSRNYTNTAIQTADGYVFSYSGEDESIKYTYRPQNGGFDDITVSVNGGAEQQLLRDSIAFTEDAVLINRDVRFDGTTVYVNEQYQNAAGEKTEDVHYALCILGKTMVAEITAFEGAISNYYHEIILDSEIPIPYMPYFVNSGIKGGAFASFYSDWTYSNASTTATGATTYGQLTDGTRVPFQERFLLTVSNTVNDVFPTIPNTPSKYRSAMAERMVFDWWGHTPDREQFSYMDQYTDYLYEYGLRDVVFLRHYWQRDGYDTSIPASYPAKASYGGDEQLIPFGNKLQQYGWLFGLHTNYTDYSPQYEYYNPEHAVRNSDGSIRIGGFLGGVWNNIMSSGFYQYYINLLEPEIHRRYSTNASFVDVFGARGPGRDVDYNVSVPGAGMYRTEYDNSIAAIARMQVIHSGPMLTEGGADHARYAGIIDGAEAQVAEATGERRGGENIKLMPDFELQKVFPLTLNHGMGYYHRWRVNVPADHLTEHILLDKYRAQQIAYGHAAYVEDRLPISNVSEVWKEYYYMLPIQKQYASSAVESVAYFSADGEEQTLSEALLNGYYNNEEQRLKITYKNGTVVYINMEEKNWAVEDKVIPQYGFYMKNHAFKAGTLLVNGKIGDYMVSENQVYFEPRTTRKYYGSLNIRPELTSIELTQAPTETEDGLVSMTFQWELNEGVPDACTAVALHANLGETWMFGGDYGVPEPMHTIENGIYNTRGTLILDKDTVKLDQDYQIGTTFYSQASGQRYAIEGYQNNGLLSMVGIFRLVKNNMGEIELEYRPYAEERANLASEMIDFGGISANEMFTAEKAQDGGWYITVLPRHRKLTLSFHNDSDIAAVYALDEEMNKIEEIAVQDDMVTLETPGANSYYFKGDICWQ